MTTYRSSSSSRRTTTVRTLRSGGSRPSRDGLVAPLALFLPGVAAVVVAVALPEAGLVRRRELDAAQPLRALPRVELGDHQARGGPVLRRERRAVRPDRDEHVVVLRRLDRDVRGEAVLAVRDDELRGRLRLHEVHDLLERDAFPLLVEP